MIASKIVLHLHALTAVITISLFIFRFVGIQNQAKFMKKTWARILPIINDTCLLVFGITLIILTKQYPNTDQQLWLIEKISFLVGYILLGYIALHSKTKQIRYIGFILALLCFTCIVYLAKMKIAF